MKHLLDKIIWHALSGPQAHEVETTMLKVIWQA